MEKPEFVWRNGEIGSGDGELAKIDIFNHSLNYGSAVFEGIRVYETPGNEKGHSAIFRLEDHVNRLFYSASVMGNNVRGFSRKEISDAIIETVKVNKIDEGYIRPLVFYGNGLGLNPEGLEEEVAIFAVPFGRYLKDEEIKVCFSKYRKTSSMTTAPGAKISGNYANSILAHLDIKKRGYDEGLLLDCGADISEGPGENIFFVKKSKLITTSSKSILRGITRDTVFKLGKENGLEIEGRSMHPMAIHDMDEAFFCGTAVEITPISEINYSCKTKKYETQEVTNLIRDAYMDTVRGKNKKHLDWLSFVK